MSTTRPAAETTAVTRALAESTVAMAVTDPAAWDPATAGPALAWVRMIEGNRAAGHAATGVSARMAVSDSRASLRKLGASHNSRADATPADHGPGATANDCRSDCRLPVKLMWAARSAAAPWDDAGRAGAMIEQAVAWQITGSLGATMAVTAGARAVRAHAVRAARTSVQQPRTVTQ